MSHRTSGAKLTGRIAAAIACSLTVLCATNAGASGVEAREERQRDRITAGIEDGSLTRGEAHRLMHQQANIERTERRFRNNDGYLGPRERLRLDRLQDRASLNIRRRRHNPRTR